MVSHLKSLDIGADTLGMGKLKNIILVFVGLLMLPASGWAEDRNVVVDRIRTPQTVGNAPYNEAFRQIVDNVNQQIDAHNDKVLAQQSSSIVPMQTPIDTSQPMHSPVAPQQSLADQIMNPGGGPAANAAPAPAELGVVQMSDKEFIEMHSNRIFRNECI